MLRGLFEVLLTVILDKVFYLDFHVCEFELISSTRYTQFDNGYLIICGIY